MLIQLKFMDNLCLQNGNNNLELLDKLYTHIQQRIASFFTYLSLPSDLKRYNFIH